jgi:hypothetical protein
MSDKPAVFFYSGSSELLATKPVNVTAIDISNVVETNRAINELGKNLTSVPSVFVRGTPTWYDEIYKREYVLPEQWICKSLSGVTDWRAVGLEPTVSLVEPVVEEPVVEVPEVVVEPVVEVPEVVVEPVVEVPEVVVEPVVE